MHRFRLIRNEDVSGVSGTGAVAEGVLFATGKVALSWLSDLHSVTVYDSVDDLERIHGHEGRTRIEWIDQEADGRASVADAFAIRRN